MADQKNTIIVLMPEYKFIGLVGEIPERYKAVIHFVNPIEYPDAEQILDSARLVISHSYISSRVNYFIFCARNIGIATLFLVDGPLEWSNSYHNDRLHRRNPYFEGALMEPLVHDTVLTISASQTVYLQYRNPGRDLSFMSFKNMRIMNMVKPSSEKAGARWQFLITTAKHPYFNDAEKHNLVLLLKHLIEAFERSDHSYVFRVIDPFLLNELPIQHNLTEGEFGDVLNQVECVIGTPSSVLLQSMASNKPTATLIYRDSPLFFQTGWLLGNFDTISTTLESMISREQTRMELQTFSLKENISQEDFYQVLDTVNQQPEKAPRTNDAETLRFEKSIYKSLLENPMNFNLPYWLYKLRNRLARNK
jgi:hypothetical protein